MGSASLAGRLAAAAYDPFLALGERRTMGALRRRLLREARGRTLELGAGTGLNVAHYPGGLASLTLTEPLPGMRARLARRVAGAGLAADVVAAGAEALPVPDRSVDTVVSTLVLCTVPDPVAALAEVRRVLAPGGRLLFVEHVRAGEPGLARWQDRLAAPWAAFAAGCRCNQDTLALLRGAFAAVEAEPARWRGVPPLVAPLLVGAAAP